jgi:hypothetical protein
MSKMWQRRIITQVLMEGAISSSIEREPDEMPDVRSNALPGCADAFLCQTNALPGSADAFVFQKFSEER